MNELRVDGRGPSQHLVTSKLDGHYCEIVRLGSSCTHCTAHLGCKFFILQLVFVLLSPVKQIVTIILRCHPVHPSIFASHVPN